MSRLTRKSISSQTQDSSENQTKTVNLNNDVLPKTPPHVPQEPPSMKQAEPSASSTKIRKECKYVGDMYAEKKHGSGVLSWSDDQTYSGAFHADKRHGFGAYQQLETFEFKGLYRDDERFGPGVLTYRKSQHVDVGFWLSDDLIRLLYPHPTLQLDIRITDVKPRGESSQILPAWYSPYQLLPSVPDFDFILNKKPVSLLCENYEDQSSSTFTRYLIEHADRVQEVLFEKRAQLEASIADFNDEYISKDMIFNERTADVPTPNQTDEQRQIFYHTNRFLPLKQQAKFPINEILSNTRSAFPEPGPLENSSLLLFELAFHGETKQIRHLLMHTQTYVDVCDSRGLTALHFATYNLHLDAINVLLDFGANVNQFTDDGLTPLSIVFLFYYGNNPYETTNRAFEHTDLVVPSPTVESRQSSSKEKSTSRKSSGGVTAAEEKKLATPAESNPTEVSRNYGYELTDDLRERMRHEQFREAVLTTIKLLLRRGADPSLSDWPLPVLTLAIRAGDLEMVELLLKKKAQVNCRLNSARHASLTPLHIACGSLEPSALSMVRLLLEHGAQTNVETSPVNQEYLSLADPLVCNINNRTETQDHGRTPLHIACAREATDETSSLVRLLLEHKANPNIVCNGQTPLSLAISMANESVVDMLLSHETIDPAISLGEGNGNALCTVVSTVYGSRWNYDKRIELIERIIAKNPRVLYPVHFSQKHLTGSTVDYAYYSFFADTRIAQTPYHILSPEERVVYKERKELLAHLAKRFREEVTKNENLLTSPSVEDLSQTTAQHSSSPHRSVTLHTSFTEKTKNSNSKGNIDFHFCATCGRSTGVRLTPCKQCEKVHFCSKACRTTGWDAFHEEECKLLQQPRNPTKVTVDDKSLKTRQTTRLSLKHTNRSKDLTESSGAFSKKNSSMNTSQFLSSSNQFSTLSPAKLIRQRRLKQLGRLPTYLDGVDLSWNYTYDGPENYSFS
ncbi:unnamed protein product [Adineta ricciae]|uniref:MYND-type domain-containing protein n=1 Tax=Adineta ricciae TaxID=249248 RepID=A0A815BRU1_ADIRI|nr:unnamed protein product [Adineta ricciae]